MSQGEINVGDKPRGSLAQATRLQRPRLLDPRLLIGIALVVASVVGVTTLLVRSDRTVAVYQAVEPLIPGTRIEAESLNVVQVRLDGVQSQYFMEGSSPVGSLVSTLVGPGDLVPRAAVTAATESRLRPVPISVDRMVAAVIGAGDQVDLWWQAPEDPAPELIAPGAIVWHSPGETGTLGAATVTVYVMVDVDTVPEVLAASDGEGSLNVIPLLGGS